MIYNLEWRLDLVHAFRDEGNFLDQKYDNEYI